MPQQLRVLFALVEDLSSVPSTHVSQLTTASNSSFFNATSLYWPHMHIHTN